MLKHHDLSPDQPTARPVHILRDLCRMHSVCSRDGMQRPQHQELQHHGFTSFHTCSPPVQAAHAHRVGSGCQRYIQTATGRRTFGSRSAGLRGPRVQSRTGRHAREQPVVAARQGTQTSLDANKCRSDQVAEQPRYRYATFSAALASVNTLISRRALIARLSARMRRPPSEGRGGLVSLASQRNYCFSSDRSREDGAAREEAGAYGADAADCHHEEQNMTSCHSRNLATSSARTPSTSQTRASCKCIRKGIAQARFGLELALKADSEGD